MGEMLDDTLETLAAFPVDPRDAALRRLLIAYADEIDGDGDLKEYGSRFLSALEAMGATPRARRGEAPASARPSRLAAFEGGRAAS